MVLKWDARRHPCNSHHCFNISILPVVRYAVREIAFDAEESRRTNETGHQTFLASASLLFCPAHPLTTTITSSKFGTRKTVLEFLS